MQEGKQGTRDQNAKEVDHTKQLIAWFLIH